MTRRTFIKSMCALPFLPWSGPSAAGGQITEGEVSFEWHHLGSGLRCRLLAPTRGWLAAGFNSERALGGTRFVMAAVAQGKPRIEEHVALVPAHKKVESVGLDRSFAEAELVHTSGGSRLSFSYGLSEPLARPDGTAVSLQQGNAVHLMLAWSRHTDFDHHSAWRRHYPITL